MRIIALLDGRPGNDNQTIAVAEKLGEYKTLKVEFSFWSKLPNFLLGTSQVGIASKIKEEADIIIATGRRLARVAAIMKKQNKCKVIQLMLPHLPLDNFDLVFVPQHDNPKKLDKLHATIGAPNRIDEKLLAQQDWKFENSINVALIGDIEASEVNKLQNIDNLHISTSRRTKPETKVALHQLQPKYIYEWSPDSENPYYGLLAKAQNIIVSADSVGMISEACTTGKKTYIFGSPKKYKFKQFINSLYDNGHAKPLKEFGTEWQPKKLNTRDDVVKIIKNYIES